MIYLIVGAACAAVGFWIFLPLLRGVSRDSARLGPRGAATMLEDRRDALLRSLKELEFDHSTGKIDDEDYAAQRAELAAQTSRVLDQIEAGIQHVNAPIQSAPRDSGESLVDERVADEIELEVLVMRARLKNARRTCDWRCACGRAMKDADLFCASCGVARTSPSDAAREIAAT